MDTPPSRRSFLLGVAGLGALTAFPLTAGCSQPAAESSALAELERALPGRVLIPPAETYEQFTTPWNLRWSGQRPVAAAVVRASSAEDVAAAVRWAARTNTPVVARSGGHSYTGYSTTSGVVIDVSSMNSVTYDAASGQAVLAGGVRNANAYSELEKVERTVTHGRCYEVGFAGLVLGGGIGFNMRRIGLTCDQLVHTQVVLASGEIVRASAEENSDLFWGLRGAGGGNFGINTSFTVQTHPAPALVAFDMIWDTDPEALLPVLFEVLRTAPPELGVKLSVRAAPATAGGVTVTTGLLGQFVGAPEALDAILAPAYAVARPNTALGFQRNERYWDAQRLLSDEGTPERMYERSRYVVDALGSDAVTTILAWLRAWPALQGSAQWKGFLTGGVINDTAADATAFVHRDNWLLSTIDLTWSASDSPEAVREATAWLDQFHDAMAPFGTNQAYQNFIDESQTDWQQAYYGANLERLVQVKRSYDPGNFFRYPQSIPLELT
jgi:FAD/FMN-containing dehydrogenase